MITSSPIDTIEAIAQWSAWSAPVVTVISLIGSYLCPVALYLYIDNIN